jgi:hypothetical protein
MQHSIFLILRKYDIHKKFSMKEVALSPRYRVTLTKEERKDLEEMTRRGKMHARRFVHARALLLYDAGVGGPAWNVADGAQVNIEAHRPCIPQAQNVASWK